MNNNFFVTRRQSVVAFQFIQTQHNSTFNVIEKVEQEGFYKVEVNTPEKKWGPYLLQDTDWVVFDRAGNYSLMTDAVFKSQYIKAPVKHSDDISKSIISRRDASALHSYLKSFKKQILEWKVSVPSPILYSMEYNLSQLDRIDGDITMTMMRMIAAAAKEFNIEIGDHPQQVLEKMSEYQRQVFEQRAASFLDETVYVAIRSISFDKKSVEDLITNIDTCPVLPSDGDKYAFIKFALSLHSHIETILGVEPSNFTTK
jgi:hypothetical protein